MYTIIKKSLMHTRPVHSLYKFAGCAWRRCDRWARSARSAAVGHRSSPINLVCESRIDEERWDLRPHISIWTLVWECIMSCITVFRNMNDKCVKASREPILDWRQYSSYLNCTPLRLTNQRNKIREDWYHDNHVYSI